METQETEDEDGVKREDVEEGKEQGGRRDRKMLLFKYELSILDSKSSIIGD